MATKTCEVCNEEFDARSVFADVCDECEDAFEDEEDEDLDDDEDEDV